MNHFVAFIDKHLKMVSRSFPFLMKFCFQWEWTVGWNRKFSRILFYQWRGGILKANRWKHIFTHVLQLLADHPALVPIRQCHHVTTYLVRSLSTCPRSERSEIQPTPTVKSLYNGIWDQWPFLKWTRYMSKAVVSLRYSNLILFIAFVLNVLFGVR
jgi:hypothetical protein